MSTKPFEYYAQTQAKGLPGMKVNVTLDTVDSFASEGGIDPGEAVIRGTDPGSQVKAVASASDISKIIGIAVHTHKDPNDSGKYYEEGYSVPVATSGDVYVEVSGSVTAGGAVAMAVNSDGEVGYYAAGATVGEATATTVSGMTYLESGAEGDLVAVRIRK